MPSGQHIGFTAEQWRQLIEEQRGSGQSQAAFCGARGLGKSTFQAWKRRLYGRRGSSVPESAAATPRPSEALEALFTPLARPVAHAAASGPAGWTVELDLGGGLCLRLRPGP